MLTTTEADDLRAILDRVVQPLPHLEPLDLIVDPSLVAALDLVQTAWLRTWRAWQYAAGPKPPAKPAYHSHNSHWLATGTGEETIARLHRLIDGGSAM
jgi:hypothetical protein